MKSRLNGKQNEFCEETDDWLWFWVQPQTSALINLVDEQMGFYLLPVGCFCLQITYDVSHQLQFHAQYEAKNQLCSELMRWKQSISCKTMSLQRAPWITELHVRSLFVCFINQTWKRERSEEARASEPFSGAGSLWKEQEDFCFCRCIRRYYFNLETGIATNCTDSAPEVRCTDNVWVLLAQNSHFNTTSLLLLKVGIPWTSRINSVIQLLRHVCKCSQKNAVFAEYQQIFGGFFNCSTFFDSLFFTNPADASRGSKQFLHTDGAGSKWQRVCECVCVAAAPSLTRYTAVDGSDE